MTTMNVKDAAGVTVAIEKPLAPGRAAATASRPVALSTEDKTALDLVATNIAALAAYVDGLEALAAALNGYVDGLEGKDFATQATLAAVLAKIITAPATEAKQDTQITGLASLLSAVDGLEGFTDGIETALSTLGTQATLAAVLAKIIAAPATEEKQNTIIGHVDGIESAFTALNAKDFATQATLAAILAKIITAPATEAKQDNAITQETAAAAALGMTAGAAVITDANGTIQQYLRGLIKQWIAGTLVVGTGANVVGKVGIDQTAGQNKVTIADISDGEYETVAASATDQSLGATGATGDYLAGVLIVPATTSPGAVSIKDGAGSAITIFAGGTGSLSNLVPFFVPLGIKSGAGAWKVTTGASVSAIGVGNFT